MLGYIMTRILENVRLNWKSNNFNEVLRFNNP